MHPLIRIVWIILIGIILVSIRRILNEKGWKIGNFIRIEDDGEDNQNEQFLKRFLSLFILTGLLFGQDVLLHKSGKNYKGTFLGKVDEKIIFKIEGEKSNSAFSINDVDIVITSRGGIKVELYYPFDIETKIEEDNSGFWKRASEAYVTGNKDEFLRQNMKPSPIPSYMVIPCALILVSILVVLGGGGVSMQSI